MKNERHNKIIELIQEHAIETQQELARLLREAGYAVTQATVSRDIRELKLTKAAVGPKKQKYVILQEKGGKDAFLDKYRRTLKDGVVSLCPAQNILVIKTLSGMAMAVAAALDHMDLEEIVGCIAGDDTILCVARDGEQCLAAMRKLQAMMD